MPETGRRPRCLAGWPTGAEPAQPLAAGRDTADATTSGYKGPAKARSPGMNLLIWILVAVLIVAVILAVFRRM